MPADVTVECSAIPAVASPIEASDNCDTDVTVTFTSNTTPGSCTDEYTITRTWVATDNCGNAITHTQTITVEDNTAPTWDQTMPADVTVECDAIPGLASPIEASDNCDTDVTITFTSNTTPGSCTDEYTITRTWVATDNCGNAITHTQTITVEDNTAPTWDQTMPADVTVECDAIPGVASPIEASDNCDTDVTITFTSNTTPGACTDEYSITRTWVATDNCGNATTYTQTITVEDTTDPTLTCPAGLTAQCSISEQPAYADYAAFASAGGSSSDNCGVNTASFAFVDDVSDNGSCPEIVTRTYVIEDNCGNTATCTQTITIDDTIEPNLVVPGTPCSSLNSSGQNLCLEDAENFDPTNLYASVRALYEDNCTPNANLVLDVETNEDGPNSDCFWLFFYDFTITDACGNEANCRVTYSGGNGDAPVLIDPAEDCSSLDISGVNECLLEANSFDGADLEADVAALYESACGDPTGIVAELIAVTPDPSNDDCSWTYTYTYEVTDDCDNTTSCTVVRSGGDTDSPVITGTMAPLDVPGCTAGSAPSPVTTVADLENFGVVVTDNCADDANMTVDASDSQSGSCPIVITRTYTVTDECTNSASVTQTITISAPPVSLICPVDETYLACQTQGAVDANFADWLSTVSVSGGCNVTLTNNSTGAPAACGGSVTVIFTVTSDCEAPVTCSATYTVPTPPALSIACPSAVVEASCQDQASINTAFTVWLGTVSAVGACDNNTVTNNNTGAPDACGGSVTVTFTATDNTCGLTSSCMATFTVTAAPDITITGVADFTTDECQTQQDVNTAFNLWLDGFSFSGGCNGVGINDLPITGNCADAATLNSNSQCYALTWASGPPVNAMDLEVTDGVNTFAWWAGTGNPGDPAEYRNVLFNGNCSQTYQPWSGTLNIQDVSDPMNPVDVCTYDSNGSFENAGGYTGPDRCGGSTTVTYTVTSDCETTSATATFTVPSAPAVTITCPSDLTTPLNRTQAEIQTLYNNWLASVTTSGGCAPVNAVPTANGPVPDRCIGGSVDVVFTATDNCGQTTSCEATFTVPPTDLTAQVSGAQTVCQGTPIQLLSNRMGGRSPYTNLWTVSGGTGTFSPSNGTNTTFTPTSTGLMTITYSVTDAAGCTATSTIQIFVPANCEAEFIIDDPCVCNNDAQVNADNGTFMELVIVRGPNGAVLPAGQNWEVTEITGAYAADANEESVPGPQGAPLGVGQNLFYCGNPMGCTVYNAPSGLQLTAPFGSYYLAFAHVDHEGYLINVEGPNAVGDPTNSDLSVSNVCFYPVLSAVSNTVACDTDGTFPITAFPQETFQPGQPPRFRGDATFVGGFPPYNYNPAVPTYIADNQDGTATFDPAVAGFGTHTISYSFLGDLVPNSSSPGCWSAIEFDIEVKATLTLTADVTNSTCSGGNDGSIDLIVVSSADGDPDFDETLYSYTWSNGATTQDLTGLASGNYSVTVTHPDACTESISFFVGEGNDTEDPVITCPGSPADPIPTTFGLCGYTVNGTEFDPTSVSDNCEFSISHNFGGWAIETSLAGATLPVGETIIIWTVTDASGNTATCDITINVEDQDFPTWVICPQGEEFEVDLWVNNCQGSIIWPIPVAEDNCPGVVVNRTDSEPIQLGQPASPR
jgi:hypothetical protein